MSTAITKGAAKWAIIGLSSVLSAMPGPAVASGGELPDGFEEIARRVVPRARAGAGTWILAASAGGTGTVFRLGPVGSRPVAVCGPLEGAFAFWVDDVEPGAGPELVVALRKKARFDPVLENRLHVYTVVGDRCAPLWRGTRLAGRYERVRVHGSRLLALERIGAGLRHLAWYSWIGFGYRVDETLWRGRGPLPRRFARMFEVVDRSE